MDSKSWEQWDSEVVVNVKTQSAFTVETRIRDWWQKSEREKTLKSSFRIWGTWSFIQKSFLFCINYSKSVSCYQQQNLTSSAYFKCPIIITKTCVKTSFHNFLHWLPWIHKTSKQRWLITFKNFILYQYITKKQI